MELQHGLLRIIYHGENLLCADEKCGRLIIDASYCFVDTINGATYCDDCGKCVRYSRKMAKQRELSNKE